MNLFRHSNAGAALALGLLNLLSQLSLAGSTPSQGVGGGLAVEDAATAIQQKLGEFLPKDISFLDDRGRLVVTGEYFTGKRPIVLNLGYYSCPSICGPVMQGMTNALNAVDLLPGKDYEVLSVSFNHKEGKELAALKKKAYLEILKKDGGEEHWHFLTGDEEAIRRLTEAVGYGFRWNETRHDYDHRAVLIFISPDGKVTRYLRGTVFDERTFRLAIVEASEGKVGTALDRFILSCYGYDPLTGTYSRLGPMVMSIGGALTLGGLLTLLFVLWRRDRRRVAPAPS